MKLSVAAASAVTALFATPLASATPSPFFFTTGAPDGRMATASRPSATGKIEIESADDFILNSGTTIESATFTGLLTGASTSDIGEVRVEIYRVFPQLSNVGRTSGPPTFSTPQVPTRVNSPSDVELDDRDTASGNLTFSTTVVSNSFSAANSVLNGIHPMPNQTTGGDGQVTGTEVLFSADFTTPFNLPAGQYFFVPQVEMTTASGEFYWLSAAGPAGPPDLQEWIRNENLAPDWLRVGTDIVGGGAAAPKFNASFSLTGTIPEPTTVSLLGLALVGLGVVRCKRRS
jgi:hypothetical protein